VKNFAESRDERRREEKSESKKPRGKLRKPDNFQFQNFQKRVLVIVHHMCGSYGTHSHPHNSLIPCNKGRSFFSPRHTSLLSDTTPSRLTPYHTAIPIGMTKPKTEMGTDRNFCRSYAETATTHPRNLQRVIICEEKKH
jgi:hypothetical protein